MTIEQDCVQSEGKLYLIFEFVDRDLKKYMEATQGMLDPMLVKVREKHCLRHLDSRIFHDLQAREGNNRLEGAASGSRRMLLFCACFPSPLIHHFSRL